MKKQGKIWALCALLALVMCLTACGGQEKTGEPEKNTGFVPKLDPKTECSITVAGHYSNFEALETEFNRFAEYYPNVQMTYTFMDGYSKSGSRILSTALAGSEAPDIFFTYPYMGDWQDGAEIFAAVFHAPVRDPETVGQEWTRWCAEGWLDFVCPMDYMTSPRRYAERIRRQKDALRAAGSKAKFYPGMAIMCSHFNQPLTPLVIAQEIAAVRAEGLEGFTLFSLSRNAERVLPVLREGPLSAD